MHNFINSSTFSIANAPSVYHDTIESAESQFVPFAGFPGSSAHSVLARDVLEQAVVGSPLIHQDPGFESALSSLRSLRKSANLDSASLGKAGERPASTPLGELPTRDELLPLLNHTTRKLSVKQGFWVLVLILCYRSICYHIIDVLPYHPAFEALQPL